MQLMQYIAANWHAWLISAGILLVAIALGLLIHYLLFLVIGNFAQHKTGVVGQSVAYHAKKPSKWIFPLLIVLIALPLVPLSSPVMNSLRHIVGLGLIAAVAWAVMLVSDVLADISAARYRMDVSDTLAARRMQTQIRVLHRIVVVIVSIVALSIMLMTFPEIHQVGASLLASAGLVGLVVGLAMKPTISSLIAGVQIALTQPIRIEDAVMINGDWGWIEEIRTTYAVVRVWDLRRLVVPLSYFIEQPFENWTRTTADLLGNVILYVDYTVPVEELRQELHRILKTTDKWRGKVAALEVTDATEHTIQIRALMDAKDSGSAWDLRCYVREKLIEFLQLRYPQSLPRTRTEFRSMPDTTSSIPRRVAPRGSRPRGNEPDSAEML